MTYQKVVERINNSEFTIESETEIANAKQIKLSNGSIINCFNNGEHNVQGENCQETSAMFSDTTSTNADKSFSDEYSHHNISHTQLNALLRKWDLNQLFSE